MKNKINKLLTLTTIGAIFMSGCTSKTIQIMDTKVNKVTVPQVKQERVSKWKSLTNSKKEECVDCYATISKKSVERVNNMESNSTVVYDYDYSKTLSDVDSVNNIKLEEYKNPYLVDELYSDNRDESLYTKIENKKLSSKNSIQVGAFRKYAGAKVYAKRYSLLTSKYNVEIKENVQDNRPLYRVQIEGFSNENEAREFMNRYGLDGAFLVRR